MKLSISKLKRNTISSFTYQITGVICGFILPRMIMGVYGSDVNGLVNSVSEFLGVITFLEMGMGAVVQSALYAPLVHQEQDQISKIIVSAQRFFQKIAAALVIYVILLIFFFPRFTEGVEDQTGTAFLVLSMSISSFGQYYFGMVDGLLLSADQRGYVQYTIQAITLVVNTICSVILLKYGASIQVVKLATSVIYLIRPIYLRHYVNKHYYIDRSIRYTQEPIPQKWNGVAQHFSAVILDGTDTIVLTLFSNFSNISVYNAYAFVLMGIKRMLLSLTNGIQSLMGELWAKDEKAALQDFFSWVEWGSHCTVVFVFGCTASLIVPFIMVYTKGVTDAEYAVPLFALLITLANAGHCLRIPYSLMILAGGHYKQTQGIYVTAALMNIVISILAVLQWGLVGVAVGTLAAMAYQTVRMAMYASQHLIDRSISIFFKQIFVDGATFIIAYILSDVFAMTEVSYAAWVILAFKVAAVWLAVILLVNVLCYREKVLGVFQRVTASKNV